ncbi:PEP-CTERM sorting domain-containing protein [Nostoc sp. UHCC 0302]|uniref:PEP-CTERM sorting domain-containing protein n=1 Tax=Nostoc sp. UHCC 0302 TaxID=3134896 RepID=UPI00311CCD93
MMKLAINLGIATAATAISVVVATKPTQAAVVNYNFTVNAISGENPGQYYGSFEYDDSTLTGIGEETLGVSNGLSILFNYLDKPYRQTNDFDYGYGYPVASFQNGNLLGLSYLVEDEFLIAANSETARRGGNKFYSILSAELTSATEVGIVSYSKVPEPFTLGGTAIAGVIGLWMKRQKKVS